MGWIYPLIGVEFSLESTALNFPSLYAKEIQRKASSSHFTVHINRLSEDGLGVYLGRILSSLDSAKHRHIKHRTL